MPKGIYKRTDEHKRHQSEAIKGDNNPMKRPEEREKLKERLKGKGFFKGKHHTEKTKNILRMKSKGNKNGKGNASKWTDEKRKIMSDMLKGNKNPNWKGGISDYQYPDEWKEDLKESIRKRDNYICQICGIHQNELEGWNKKLDVHHIDYDKDNLDPKNLVILCRKCHIKTNYNREYWIEYFK